MIKEQKIYNIMQNACSDFDKECKDSGPGCKSLMYPGALQVCKCDLEENVFILYSSMHLHKHPLQHGPTYC